MERVRHETIEEFFFEVPVWDAEGNFCAAPQEAIDKYEELKEKWMSVQPESRTEIPSIALYPVYKGSRQGYIVATQIVYKPSATPEEGQ